MGNRIARKLNVLGIKTALDLALTNPAFIRKNFSVVLERTVRELNGESCLSLEEAPPTKQQIVCSRSFGVKITEYESLRQAICQHAERASEKLRKEHQYCRHISVFIKTSPFAIKEPYYGNVATEKLLTPTQDTRDIIAAATMALERIWRDGHRYAKAGVMLNDFTGSGVSQLQLFDERPPRPHSAELMRVLDGINNSGLGKVWFAGRGIAPSWQMKRDMLSLRTPLAGEISPLRGSVKFCLSERASSARRSRTTGRSPRVSEEAPGELKPFKAPYALKFYRFHNELSTYPLSRSNNLPLVIQIDPN